MFVDDKRVVLGSRQSPREDLAQVGGSLRQQFERDIVGTQEGTEIQEIAGGRGASEGPEVHRPGSGYWFAHRRPLFVQQFQALLAEAGEEVGKGRLFLDDVGRRLLEGQRQTAQFAGKLDDRQLSDTEGASGTLIEEFTSLFLR